MYQINFLTDKEFDSLPYDGINDSLGFADPRMNRAYVRLTQSHELNKYLLAHEFEHLVEEHATDEDTNGLRHKKASKIFQAIFHPTKNIFTQPVRSVASTVKDAITGGGQQPEFDTQAQVQPDASAAQFPVQNLGSGPFGQFDTNQASSSRLPENIGGSVAGGGLTSGGLNQQAGGESQISEDLKQRIRGFYSGRIAF